MADKEAMKIKDITDFLERKAHLATQESYDNSGLLVGDNQQQVTGVLVSLDCTEDIVDEAVSKGCNLIVSHHPIVFKGLKSLTGKNYVERTVIKAIQSGVALYAIHTNLDNYRFGVNFEIGKRLGLSNLSVLSPVKGKLSKLVTYVPKSHLESVREAVFSVGAGTIGEYDKCSFSSEGMGSFRALENASPYVGEKGQLHEEPEIRLEVVLPEYREGNVVRALLAAHPYEEVAYDLFPLKNKNQFEGAGMVGELDTPMEMMTFLEKVKQEFSCGTIRYTDLVKKEVKKVAFCGGSGSFLLNQAIRSEADLFITGDFKYHEFFDADGHIVIADIGHYESEQFTIDLIGDSIRKNFTTFAVHLTELNTNPVNYL